MEAALWSAIAIVAALSTGTLFVLLGRIDDLGSRVDNLGSRVDTRLDGLAARIDALTTETVTRFDA